LAKILAVMLAAFLVGAGSVSQYPDVSPRSKETDSALQATLTSITDVRIGAYPGFNVALPSDSQTKVVEYMEGAFIDWIVSCDSGEELRLRFHRDGMLLCIAAKSGSASTNEMQESQLLQKGFHWGMPLEEAMSEVNDLKLNCSHRVNGDYEELYFEYQRESTHPPSAGLILVFLGSRLVAVEKYLLQSKDQRVRYGRYDGDFERWYSWRDWR